MQQNNYLTKVLLFLIIDLFMGTSAFAQVLGLNPSAKPADAPPPNIKTLSAIFPLMSHSGMGLTYWSYRANTNGAFPHTAIDLPAAEGTPVEAVDMGTVMDPVKKKIYFGTYVVLNGPFFVHLYAHLSEQVVFPGDFVVGGQLIGNVGNTGNSKGPHLHFMVGASEGDQSNINPLKIWINHFDITNISAAGSIIPPDNNIHTVSYTFLQPLASGDYPTVTDVSASIESLMQQYNYSVRAVLYFNGKRDASAVPDRLASMNGSLTFTSVPLPNPVIPGSKYPISIILYDSEEMQNDSSTSRLFFAAQAAKNPIARADVDLYVPEALTINAAPNPAEEGQSVSFSLQNTPTLGQGPYTYDWDFGDGASVPGANSSSQGHSYALAGLYTVKVSAKDKNQQVVAMGKVQVTVQKKKKPDPPTPPGPGPGPGGGGGPGSSPYLPGPLPPGIPINPNPKGPMVPFGQVCGTYRYYTYYDQFGNITGHILYLDMTYLSGASGWHTGSTHVNWLVPCSAFPPNTLVPSDLFYP